MKTTPYVVGRTRTRLVMLTERGRDLLEAYRRLDQGQARQAFYAGVAKPKELAHDTRLHQAYLKPTSVCPRVASACAELCSKMS